MKLTIEFLKYLVAGGVAAATHLVVLIALVQLVSVPKPFASAIGFCCATPVNYILQHKFVFKRSGRHSYYFLRYITVTLMMMLVNVGIFWIFTNFLHINYILAQVLVIAIIAIGNYIFNRSFTFAVRKTRLAR